jgi:hypothetical protein
MLGSAVHKDALERFGLLGYWSSLAFPVLFIWPLFAIFGVRAARLPTWATIVIALFAAMAVAYLGLFGKWLLCVFVTKGICE